VDGNRRHDPRDDGGSIIGIYTRLNTVAGSNRANYGSTGHLFATGYHHWADGHGGGRDGDVMRLRHLFSLPTICPLPAGIVADNSAAFALFRLMANVNNYSLALTTGLTATGGITLTTAQFLQGIINVTVSGGAANLTLPTTAQLLAAMGPTVPIDGTWAEPFHVMNNGTGQTLTLVAGDASTTITGTATVATNTYREFLVTVNAPGTTLTVQNLGTRAL
jgi:hypothetical protein